MANVRVWLKEIAVFISGDHIEVAINTNCFIGTDFLYVFCGCTVAAVCYGGTNTLCVGLQAVDG